MVQQVNESAKNKLKMDFIISLFLSLLLFAFLFVTKLLPLYLCITGVIIYFVANSANYYITNKQVNNLITKTTPNIYNNTRYNSFLNKYTIIALRLSYIIMFLTAFGLKCIER